MADSLLAVALGARLAERLRGRIVRGAIAPGTHLVEDAVASEHGVSRGPVRDALRILTGEGLLESRRRGFFVRGFTQEDIDELYQIREAAEQLAGRLAVRKAAPADWDIARRHLAEMRTTARLGDSHAYAKADLAFHTQYYQLSGNARLLSLWQQFQPTFATLLEVTNEQDADLEPSAEDHEALMGLTEAGDADGFTSALSAHLAGSHRRMSNAMAARSGSAAAPATP